MTISLKPVLIAAGLVLTLPLCTLAGDVYKTVDPDGHVTYSDHALSPNSKKISVDVIPANPQDAARVSRQMAAVNADAAQRAKAAAQQASDQDKDRQKQQELCQHARQQYAMFSGGGRLYHMDDQGERVYYSDAEIDAQRASAKAAMDAACTQ